MPRYKLLPILLLLYVIPLYSQEKADMLNEFTKQVIQEVEIHAPVIIKSKLQWPGAVASIAPKQIFRGNSYQIADQLNSLPGVFMQQGTLSTNRITIRGVGSRTPYNTNRIKAYWGEIPLTDGDGVTSVEDIGLNDMGGVDVLKGPSSSLYGAGLGGVIIVKPFDYKSNLEVIDYRTEYAAFGTYSNQLNLNFKNDSTGYIGVAAGALSSDGYRENNQYKRYNLSLMSHHLLGAHRLNAFYRYKYLDAQIPSSINGTDFMESPEKAAFTWKSIGGYENSKRHMAGINLVSPLKAELYHTISLFGSIATLDELRPFNQLKEDRNSLGLRDKFVYRTERFRYELGTEMLFEHTDISLLSVEEANRGDIIGENRIKRGYANVFGLLESSPKSGLTYQLSINANRTFYRFSDTGMNTDKNRFSYDWVFSPRIGANYKYSQTTTFYASVGHGFSSPSLEEAQLPDGTFNKQIKPEEGWGYDLGYRFMFAQGRIYGDVNLYAMHLKNLLVTKRDNEDEFYGINAGKTKHWGIENSISLHLVKPFVYRQLLLTTNLSWSQNEFVEFTDDGNVYDGNKLPGIPSYQLSMNLNYLYKMIQINASYQNFGQQFLDDANANDYNAYEVLNLKASLHKETGRIKFELYIGVNNFLNEHYASMLLINAKSFGGSQPRYYYPALPRNYYGGVKVSW